jgi:tetratricopeptide (TPR) repeat protein
LVLQEQVNEYRSLVQREDYTTAADLLVQLAAPLLTGGQARRFLDLLEAIPEPILHRHRDLLIAAGNAWLLCDNWQHAGNCYRQAQELTDIAGDALTAGRIFTSRGLVCWRRGDIAGALRWYDQALQALDGVAEAHPVRAELDSNYALAFSSLGALHDAEPILQRQLRMFQRNADANGERMTLHNLGMMIAVRRGDFQAAETLLREALRIAQEHALRYGELYVANSLAYALIWQGKAAEALALSLHAQALGEELGTPNPLAFALLNRAAALLQQGNHPGAERACTQARAQLDSALSAPLHCDILLVQAQLQQVHCTAQAYQTAQQALRAAHGDRWMLDQAQLHVASLALDLTRSAEAQAALNEAGLIFQDFADRYHLLRWAVLAARGAQGQHDRAARGRRAP